MAAVELSSNTVVTGYNGLKVIESLTETVKIIGMSNLKDRVMNFKTPMGEYLGRFTSNTSLSECDARTQKLFHNIVAAVKEQLGRNPLMKEAVALPDDAPYYLHFALQPVKDLIAKLDNEQPGSVEDLIKPPKVEGPRVSLADLETLEKAIENGQIRSEGLDLIPKERLNALKLDRDDLVALTSLSDEQERVLSRLKALIAKCENHEAK